MLKIAYSGLLNAQIEHTVIMSDLDKLMEALFFTTAVAWLGSRRALHGALAGRKIAGASFSTLTGRRHVRLIGWEGTILPCCWRRSCWCLLRWRSLVELCSCSALLNTFQSLHRIYKM